MKEPWTGEDASRVAHLLEHAILVADAIAPARQVQGGHAIEEASSQTPKTTVSKRSIALGISSCLHTEAQLVEGVGIIALKLQVVDGVDQRPTHQELGREVVDELGVLLAAFASKIQKTAQNLN